MRFMRRLKLRIRSLVSRHRLERELDEEMRFHLDALMRQQIDLGRPDHSAQAEARRQFGGVAQYQEACRDERRTRWIETLVADVRYACRLFARSPGFTAIALVSLALGIGANTAVFTLVEAVSLRSLPARQPEQLVCVVGLGPREQLGNFSYPTYEWLRRNATFFSAIFTWNSVSLEAGEGEAMEWVNVDRVSEEYFTGLGLPPAVGRLLADETSQPAVAVLSHHWWRNRFKGDPAVVGRTVRLGGVQFAVVGVAPEGFAGTVVGASPDVFVPLLSESITSPGSTRLTRRDASWLPMMGRLRDGTTRAQAVAALQTLWPAMTEESGPRNREGQIPAWFRQLEGHLEPAPNGLSPLWHQFHQPLWVMLAIVGIVLLIACVNLSNLLLARSVARQREMALRVAIGASASRLLRQVLTESVALATAGAALGLVAAYWGSHLFPQILSTNRNPIHLDLRPNPIVLAFTMAVTVLTTLLFGLVPAMRARRSSVQPLIKDGSHRTTRSSGFSRALVVAQVALSLLLVIGAAIFLRTLHNLLSVDLGFDADRVLIASIAQGRAGVSAPDRSQFLEDLHARLERLPGVEAVSFSKMTPIQNCCWWESLVVHGATTLSSEKPDVYLNDVAPDYFRTMGTRVLRGRDFDEGDSAASRHVAIVNESFARRFFGDQEPLGRIIALPPGYKNGPMEIVGIVADARYIDLKGPTRLAAYFPLAQSESGLGQIELLIRTPPGSPLALAADVRREVHFSNARVPVRFRSLAQEVDSVLTYERMLAILSVIFGGLAIALAAIGLYGMLSYSVVQRTSEIGVRMALGATRASVLWLVMKRNVALVAAGLVVGVGVAAFLSRYLETLVFQMAPADPFAFVLGAAVLATVAVIASWLPARRAVSCDPVRALRYE